MTSFARSREPSLSLRARACTGALAVATRESRGTACCLPRGHRGGEGRLHGWSGGGAKGQKKELKSSCGESRDEASSWVFPLALPLFFFSSRFLRIGLLFELFLACSSSLSLFFSRYSSITLLQLERSANTPITMRVSTPLAAAGRQQQMAVVATSETGRRQHRRRQPSSSPVPNDLSSSRRRPSFLRPRSVLPPSQVTSTTTSTTDSPSSEVSNELSRSTHDAAISSASSSASSTNPTSSSPIISLDQLPRPLRDSVVVLSAPNPQAPGGKVPVYVLGVSHVSKTSLERVRRLM